MKSFSVLSVLLLSAAIVTPASANWFSNPNLNINRFIGSAPNPKPEDVRENRMPVLVRDADGNVVAMVDPATGKQVPVTPEMLAQLQAGKAQTH